MNATRCFPAPTVRPTSQPRATPWVKTRCYFQPCQGGPNRARTTRRLVSPIRGNHFPHSRRESAEVRSNSITIFKSSFAGTTDAAEWIGGDARPHLCPLPQKRISPGTIPAIRPPVRPLQRLDGSKTRPPFPPLPGGEGRGEGGRHTNLNLIGNTGNKLS